MVDPAGPGGQFMLNAVAVADAGLVWAVGQTTAEPLVERWDGTTWKAEPVPATPAELHAPVLRGVSAVGPGAAIAVGGAFDRLDLVERPLAYAWDGLVWNDLGLAASGTGRVLAGVVMTSPAEAWAVGSVNVSGGRAGRPLILHWTGGEWHDLVLDGEGRLAAVTAGADSDLWAVGVSGSGSGRRPLVLRHGDGRWREVPCRHRAERGLTCVAVGGDGAVWAGGGDVLLRWEGKGWRPYDHGLASVNALAATPAGGVLAAGGKGGLSALRDAAFLPLATPDDRASWLGAAAGATTVWVVGSRRRGGGGEAVSAHRPGHLIAE
jgi:hypothetical protein